MTAGPVTREMQSFRLIDGQVGREGGQVALDRADLGEHRAEVHGDQAAEPKVGVAFAPVGEARDELAHAGVFCGGLQTFRGMRAGHDPQGGGPVALAQNGAGARAPFAHPELLGMSVGQVEILAGLPAALGLAQQGPAAGFVRGAAQLLRIDKTLGLPDWVSIEVSPILAEPRQTKLQAAAGQIGDVPGLQDQEAALVGHERKPALVLRGSPADPGCAGLQVGSSGAPGQQADPLALRFGHIARRLAHEMRTVQIVLFDQPRMEAGPRPGLEEGDLHAVEQMLLGIAEGRSSGGIHSGQGKKSVGGSSALSTIFFSQRRFLNS